MIYSDLLNAANNQACVTGQLTSTNNPPLSGILLSSPNGLYIYQVLFTNTYQTAYVQLNVFSRNTQTGNLTLTSSSASPNEYSLIGAGGDTCGAVLSQDGLRLYYVIGNGTYSRIGSFLLNPNNNTFVFINSTQSGNQWSGGGNQNTWKKLTTSATSGNPVEILYHTNAGLIVTYSVNKSTGFISSALSNEYISSSLLNLNACVTSDNKYLLVSGVPNESQLEPGNVYSMCIYRVYLINYSGAMNRYYGDIRVNQTTAGVVCQIIKAPSPNITSYGDTSDHFYILTTRSIYFLKYTSDGFQLVETYKINDGNYFNSPQEAFNNPMGIPTITRIGEKSNLYYRVNNNGGTANKWGAYRRNPFTGRLSPLSGMFIGTAYNSDNVCIPTEGGHVYTSSSVYKQSVCPETKSIFKPLSATLYSGSTYLGSFTFTENTYSSNNTTSSFISNSVNFYEISVHYLTLGLAPIYSPAICVIYSGTPTTFSQCQPQAVRADSTITHTLGGFTINITYGPPTNPTR